MEERELELDFNEVVQNLISRIADLEAQLAVTRAEKSALQRRISELVQAQQASEAD